MKFKDRIKGDLHIVELTNDEIMLYEGQGYYLAIVEDGAIVELKEIDEGMEWEEIITRNYTNQMNKIKDWIGDRECWFGHMSCHDFYDVELYSLNKASRLARLIWESNTEN